MSEEHWSSELTHEKLATPEAKQSLSQYNTMEEALVGGLEAKRQVGKPFKLPESLSKVDTWPDPKDRDAFRTGISKLLEVPSSAEDLKDIDFSSGLPDARQANPEMVKAFTEFCVQEGVPKRIAGKLAHFNNQFVTKIAQSNTQAEKSRITQTQESLKLLFGEDLKVHDDRVRVLFMNHCGLSPQEYEQSISEIMDAGIAKNPILAKALYNLSKDVVKEGQTSKPGTAEPAKPVTMKQRLPRSYNYIRGTAS